MKKFSQQQLLALFACIILITTSTATYTYLSRKNAQEKISASMPDVLSYQTEEVSNEEEFISTQEFALNQDFTPDQNFAHKESIAFLLLGYGGAGHQGGFLTDVLQVVHFDFKNKKIAFISLPRDLIVTAPDGSSQKINAVLSKTGTKGIQEVVTKVTGIPLDGFVSIDFVGFKRAIGGVLDGISVAVSEPLNDPWYPIAGKELEPCGKTPEEIAQLTRDFSGFELEKQFPCRYEHIQYSVGTHHMEGGDALAYVRSRHGSAGGDFSRSKRQHEVLLAVADKLFTLKALENAPKFFTAFSAHVTTSLTLQTVITLVPKLATTKDMQVNTVTLSTQNVLQTSNTRGSYGIIPKAGSNNWEDVHAFVAGEMRK